MTVFPANAVTAPCKREDPELFFPPKDPKPARVKPAKAVCNRGNSGAPCSFFDECLSYALRIKVEGVWAATTDKEREAIRQKHGIKAEPLSFSSGPTNATTVKRMYGRGRAVVDIAAHLGITTEAVRHVIRADQERRSSEGRPPKLDPKVPVACEDCGSMLLPISLRKHQRGYCPARPQVAS